MDQAAEQLAFEQAAIFRNQIQSLRHVQDKQYVESSKGEDVDVIVAVEEGGLIVGNSDCASGVFNTSFRKLAKNLFPLYEFKDLAPTDPMLQNPYARARWKN